MTRRETVQSAFPGSWMGTLARCHLRGREGLAGRTLFPGCLMPGRVIQTCNSLDHGAGQDQGIGANSELVWHPG
jgi:hypothetical protein